MKRTKSILLLLLCCLIMAACAQNDPSGGTATVPPATALPTSPAVTDAPTAPLFTLSVYRGNANAEGFVFEDVQVPEINETVVLEQLIAAGVLPEGTAIHSFSMTDGRIQIDFNDVFLKHLNSMGTTGEWILTGSVVNTFLRAFDAQDLVFTVDSQIAESGHVIYDFPLEFVE